MYFEVSNILMLVVIAIGISLLSTNSKKTTKQFDEIVELLKRIAEK